MYPLHDKIKAYVESHKQEMLDFMVDFINLEGHYEEKENVEKAMDFYRKALEEEGFTCKYTEIEPPTRAGLLVADLGMDRPGKPILLEGHIDTVHKTGSFGGPNPCRIQDGKIYGPGVLDMKGGMVIALYIAKALNAVGFNDCPIRIVACGDEEADHVGNNCNLLITEAAKGCGIGLSFEVSTENDFLATRRKSQIVYHITIHGVGGHAGNNFWDAKNVLFEANRIINEVTKLTSKETETTVTPSVLHAGEQQTAIPDVCKLVFDIRFCNLEERKRVTDTFERILNNPTDGYKIDWDLEVAQFIPLDETDEVLSVWDFINEAAVSCGYKPFGKMLRGGANDAGNILAGGCPVIDGCGTTGNWSHNVKEYANIDSLYKRTEIFATALSKAAEFKVKSGK